MKFRIKPSLMRILFLNTGFQSISSQYGKPIHRKVFDSQTNEIGGNPSAIVTTIFDSIIILINEYLYLASFNKTATNY